MVKKLNYKFEIKGVNVFYGSKQAINDISLNIEENKIREEKRKQDRKEWK